MKGNTQNRINLITNIATLFANILVALYYTPYLVEKLGIATYGVLPLALIVNQYINVATGMLTNSFTRFYSIAIQKGDYQDASKVLTTSIYVVLAIILLITPAIVFIILKVDSVFNIPDGLLIDAQILFSYTILSFYLSLMSSFLNVTLYALNRLDIMNYMRIARQVLKLLLVIAFFELFSINLPLVGLANFVTEGIVLVISFFYFFKFKPSEVHTHWNFCNKTTLYAILGMSIWVLLQECGDTFLYRTDNILINHWLGSEASGRVGAMSELGGYIKAVVAVLGSVYGPLILIAYSKSKHNEVQELAMSQANVVGCLAAILCGVIASVSSELLALWIDSSFFEYGHWLLFKLLPIPFFAAGSILSFVYRAWNRVKAPAIWTLIIGIVDILVLLPICILSKEYLAEKVLIVSGFFSIIQSYILGIFMISRIYPDCKKAFLPITAKIIMTMISSCFITHFLKMYINVNSFLNLVLILVIAAVLSLIVLILIIFNKKDRNSIIAVFK